MHGEHYTYTANEKKRRRRRTILCACSVKKVVRFFFLLFFSYDVKLLPSSLLISYNYYYRFAFLLVLSIVISLIISFVCRLPYHITHSTENDDVDVTRWINKLPFLFLHLIKVKISSKPSFHVCSILTT
jgi:uncharacterized sodium:solute symporter family permease YidK